MAEVAKAIRVVAPNAKIMANLLPIRNESLHKSWYCEGGANMTMKTAYRNYLDAVVEKLGIDYIQYDDYPILGDNVSKTSILDTHITNAQFVADYCKEKGLEFRKVFQTSSYRTGTPICRIPNETDMYWQMNIGMATGVILDKDNNLQVPNRLIKKVHDYISEEKAGDDSNYNNLQGCLVVSEQINGKFGQYRKQLLKERRNKDRGVRRDKFLL